MNPRYTRARQCEGKERFPSRRTATTMLHARREKLQSSRDDLPTLHVYHCCYCDGYHVGRVPIETNRGNRRRTRERKAMLTNVIDFDTAESDAQDMIDAARIAREYADANRWRVRRVSVVLSETPGLATAFVRIAGDTYHRLTVNIDAGRVVAARELPSVVWPEYGDPVA